jgi:pimeloyl-ACP methyl ester carboxylesterase
MAIYVLIAGAAHGGWCWERVAPLLQFAGHTVLTPDLLGLGADTTPVAQIDLQAWVRQVVTLIEAQSEKVILLGHSRGGLVISQVAEEIPERIERLVYLTAFLLESGQTLGQVAMRDTEAAVVPNLVIDDDAGVWLIKQEAVVPSFYADVDPAELPGIFARLKPEPLFSLHTPQRLTAERFGHVKRTYIECEADRAITLQCQRRMQLAWPCERVVTLPGSHSPFYARPAALAQALLAEA